MKPISGPDLCKELERAGWGLERIKGSHFIYAKPGERRVISVPVHGTRNIKIGLAARIARDAKISW